MCLRKQYKILILLNFTLENTFYKKAFRVVKMKARILHLRGMTQQDGCLEEKLLQLCELQDQLATVL